MANVPLFTLLSPYGIHPYKDAHVSVPESHSGKLSFQVLPVPPSGAANNPSVQGPINTTSDPIKHFPTPDFNQPTQLRLHPHSSAEISFSAESRNLTAEILLKWKREDAF